MTTQPQAVIALDILDLKLELAGFASEATIDELEAGLVHCHLPLADATGPLVIAWVLPAAEVQANWHPDRQFFRGVPMPFADDPRLDSSAFGNAPVQCLHDFAGRNILSFAVDEVRDPVRLTAEVHEDDACMHCRVELAAADDRSVLTLRLDRRPVTWQQAVAAVGRWWLPVEERLPISGGAAEPLWCTWYVYHQRITDAQVAAQADAAVALGIATIAIDDAWQTGPEQSRMGGTGDWAVNGLDDLPGLVEHIHGLGLRAALWFAPPFLGHDARARETLGTACLTDRPGMRCAILDPRDRAVHVHILQAISQRVAESRVDGVFLDFLGSWTARIDQDGVDVVRAGDALASELTRQLRQVDRDLHIQYRMPYHGPCSWSRADILRANDCPADALTNRLRVLDMRALVGDRIVHGDMALWHPAAGAEVVAAQLQAQLFAVPQLSVDLTALTPPQQTTLTFWLRWWRSNRDLLLRGELLLEHPELLYTQAHAVAGTRCVSVCYADRLVRCPQPEADDWQVVNGGPAQELVLVCPRAMTGTVLHCDGTPAASLSLTPGANHVALPAYGLVAVRT